MNKTIKQAERYEAPSVKEYIVLLRTYVLQTSTIEGGSINQMEKEDVTW